MTTYTYAEQVADEDYQEAVQYINLLAVCQHWAHLERMRDYINALIEQRDDSTFYISDIGNPALPH
jgi:hypothetical protein